MRDKLQLQRFELKVHVAYLREAWLPHDDNSVRVTMDRQVRDDPEPTARLSTQMTNPVLVFGDSVILEIKFTGRFPHWLADMVRAFNLRPCSAANNQDVSRSPIGSDSPKSFDCSSPSGASTSSVIFAHVSGTFIDRSNFDNASWCSW